MKVNKQQTTSVNIVFKQHEYEQLERHIRNLGVSVEQFVSNLLDDIVNKNFKVGENITKENY